MANLSGSGAPSVNTVGTPGDIYTDTLTGTEYELNSIVTVTNDEETVTSYMWDRIFEFGGGGETGPQGPPGPAGADGEDGGYYTPSVSDTGDLTWTASEEGVAAIPSVNIKGPKGDPGDIFESTKILPSSTIDFNTITENGIYSRNGVPSGEDIHSPFASKRANFILMMIQRNNTYGYGYQIAFNNTTNSEIYFRVYYNRTFEEWKKIATEKDLEGYLPLTGGTLTGNITLTEGTQLLGNAESATRPLYQSIIRSAESPPNLNDYVYNGFYYVSGASGGGLTNEPVTGAAALYHVFALPTGTTQVVQRCYIMAGLENQIYQRRKNAGAWSQWTKVLTEEDDVATKEYVDQKIAEALATVVSTLPSN